MIADQYIDSISDETELDLRVGLATADTSTISGYPWDMDAETLADSWQRYLRRLMWPYDPQPGRTYYCRHFTASNADAEWAAAQRSLTRQTSGEGDETNEELLKRTLKAYNTAQ